MRRSDRFASERHREVAEELAWAIECRESLHGLARRLGYASPDVMADALSRWGDEHLARRVRHYADERTVAA